MQTFRFESEPLKAALATDSCIGAMISPSTPGSGYVLLHHVMGELDGIRGAWGYPEGGMGAVSAAIAKSALSVGAQLFTDSAVKEVNYLEKVFFFKNLLPLDYNKCVWRSQWSHPRVWTRDKSQTCA